MVSWINAHGNIWVESQASVIGRFSVALHLFIEKFRESFSNNMCWIIIQAFCCLVLPRLVLNVRPHPVPLYKIVTSVSHTT